MEMRARRESLDARAIANWQTFAAANPYTNLFIISAPLTTSGPLPSYAAASQAFVFERCRRGDDEHEDN